MKPIFVLKAALYVTVAAGTAYGAGMTADGGWHVPPSVVLGAVVQGALALRAFVDKSAALDATPIPTTVVNSPADPVPTSAVRP